jgi:hypothetical protein
MTSNVHGTVFNRGCLVDSLHVANIEFAFWCCCGMSKLTVENVTKLCILALGSCFLRLIESLIRIPVTEFVRPHYIKVGGKSSWKCTGYEVYRVAFAINFLYTYFTECTGM